MTTRCVSVFLFSSHFPFTVLPLLVDFTSDHSYTLHAITCIARTTIEVMLEVEWTIVIHQYIMHLLAIDNFGKMFVFITY
jgi:hypothetical protein